MASALLTVEQPQLGEECAMPLRANGFDVIEEAKIDEPRVDRNGSFRCLVLEPPKSVPPIDDVWNCRAVDDHVVDHDSARLFAPTCSPPRERQDPVGTVLKNLCSRRKATLRATIAAVDG